MLFGEDFARMLRSQQLVQNDWKEFCDTLERVSETILEMKSEGEAVEKISGSLITGGIPESVFANLTNKNLSKIVQSSSEQMRKVGMDKKYLFGVLNVRGTLDLYIFNPVSKNMKSVTASIPDYGNEFAARLFQNVWIRKNINKYAEENGMHILWDVTNIMCNLNQ